MGRRALLLLTVGLTVAPALAQGPLGFSPGSKEAEERAERVFLETPTPNKAREWLAALTEEPHVAGTPQAKVEADYVRDRMKEFGLEVDTVRYDVFLNHPRSVSLKLVEPVEMPLSLREDPEVRDKDSGPRGMFPGFHGYSPSGKAESQVVYVNYGTHADFERLKSLGVSVQGRIVLVRYGENFRGLKVKEAQERGALGVLIYSDPADDGYAKGDVYPDGPMRPPSAIQRGSVQFLSYGPGDPSTPGYASTPNAKRVPREKMDSLPRIPSLPLGYGEAEKILRRIGGSRVPDSWQGGLPFAYHLGPGLAAVAMDVQMDEGIKPIYDIMVRIPGTTEPDSLVILGNHRDAWTPGAVDPSSGTAAMLETARGLAASLKAGWKPRRTILLASWDAEEYGLIGSTEWAEDHASELRAHAVAYVNLDTAVTGRDLEVGGVPSLRELVREVASSMPEPFKGGSVGASWERRLRSEWAEKEPVDLGNSDRAFELELHPLGSGSDYTAFLDHLGVPCLDFSFSGPYGVYHAVYDDFFWMSHFGDPEFLYHQAAARFYGLLALRLASADVIPLRFSSYARALQKELDALRRNAVRRTRKPAEPYEKAPINPRFQAVEEALRDLGRAGEDADRAIDELLLRGKVDARLNDSLTQVERAFLSPEGLPGRPWFQHTLVAPGLTTGYAAWPFPGLTQAVEDGDAALFEAETRRVVGTIGAGAERLRAIAALVQRP